MDTALPAENIVSFGALYFFFFVLLFSAVTYLRPLVFTWPNINTRRVFRFTGSGSYLERMTVIYLASLGKEDGEKRRGLMPFLYSIRAFSEINKYQRKKGGARLLGLAKSMYYIEQPLWKMWYSQHIVTSFRHKI